MKLEFEKPRVPNFIRTKQGVFDIKDLNDEEIDEFTSVFRDQLKVMRKYRNEN